MRSSWLVFVLGALCALATPARASEASVSGPLPKVVLYTMGEGDVLWEKFGHAAICLEYAPATRLRGACFNYGTTDFSAPVSIGWNFVRGQGRFWVSTTSPQAMIQRYIEFDRTLWRQELPLTAEQTRAVAAKLQHDILPENRYYTYHHFYDNCTTRIRDIIDQATGGALRDASDTTPGPTFRDFSRQGFDGEAWLLLLTDYLLGRGADVAPDMWQAMFLPTYLRQHVHERLGVEPVLIYERRGPISDGHIESGRGWLLFLGFFIVAPLAFWRLTGRAERASIATATVPLFLISLVLWFLAAITAVNEFRYNEALLLYVPTDLALPFLGRARRTLYARVRLAILAVAAALLAAGVFTQPLWLPLLIAALPMALLAFPRRPA